MKVATLIIFLFAEVDDVVLFRVFDAVEAELGTDTRAA